MIGMISDIHGNYEALKEVLNFLDFNGVTKIYCLGDIIGYYTQINECCAVLREKQVMCIMGNHDWYMASGSSCPRSKSVNDCLKYQRDIISESNKTWLQTLKIYHKECNMHMVHGGWENPIDEYLEPFNEYFEKMEYGYYFSGHTHVQKLTKYRNHIYCNPGSVGQPRDGDNRAAFATIRDGDIQLHRVSYDYQKVGNLMEQAGFSGYYYEGLEIGAKNLGFIKS